MRRVTFRLVFDTPRQRDTRLVRHQHEKPAGDCDIGGQTRAFFADGILHHLHDDLFAFMYAIADRGARLVIEVRGEGGWSRTRLQLMQVCQATGLARAEEPRAVEPNIHKSCLHAGQHPLHASENNVSDQAVAAAPAAPLAERPIIQAD